MGINRRTFLSQSGFVTLGVLISQFSLYGRPLHSHLVDSELEVGFGLLQKTERNPRSPCGISA